MKDRIKMIRTDAGLTQEAFGNMIGSTRGMVTTYEKGTIPTLATRMLICEKFNVNEAWLETGEGLPYKEGLIPALVHALREMPDVLALLERKLPYISDETFRKMNDAVKAFVKDTEK